MSRPAILVAALLLPLLAGPAAGWEQEAGSSGASAQTSPTPQENSQPTSDQAQPSGAADQAPPTAKPEPPAASIEKTDKQKTPQSSTGAKKRRPRGSKPVAATATGEPRKVVIRQGGTSETVAQIMPGMTQEEANRQRQETEQLLAETDSDLRQLFAHALSSSQQETIGQIRHYMDVARSALKDGDTQRAHTLAVKAHLLSDDLLKH